MGRDSVKDAWLKGIASAQSARSAGVNPYAAGTKLLEMWLAGMRKGVGGEAPVRPRPRSAGSLERELLNDGRSG